MAAPALLRNVTLRGWRAPAGSQTSSYVYILNADATTTFSVVSKSDTNLTINSLTYFTHTAGNYLRINWSNAISNNSNGSATAVIRATNTLGEYSEVTVNFSFVSRISTAPGFDNYGGSLTCANRGDTTIEELMFINTNNGASTGLLSVHGDYDINNPGNGSPGPVVHARMTSNTAARVWCVNPTPGVSYAGTIAAAVVYRLTNGNSGTMGGGQNVNVLTSTATVTRLEQPLGPFNLSYEEGFLHEIFYLGALPESIAITGLPAGLSVIKQGYRYFIGGNPTAIGTFNCNITGFQSTTAVPSSFTINVTGTPPILTSPASGTIPLFTIPINKPFAGYQPTVQQPYSFPLTWTVGGLPPGMTADSSGFISGTPTQLGTYNPAIIVSGGGSIDSGNISITVVDEILGMPTEFFDNFYIN